MATLNATVREDKRNFAQLRPIHITQDLLQRVDGSAEFSFGSSSVICSIYGPAEVKIRDEKLDKATIEVFVRPVIGTPGTKDKTDEFNLRTTFESVIMTGLHPRTLIQIVAQVKHDDGSILATAINATCLALIDAGVPMKAIITAVTCIVTQQGDVLVDPTSKEAEEAVSTHTFAFDSLFFNAVLCESNGIFTEKQFLESYVLCKSGANQIYEKIRESLGHKFQIQYISKTLHFDPSTMTGTATTTDIEPRQIVDDGDQEEDMELE
ncbi:6468_t:CDS:2 [Ambispora gerdemannii]|uniref:6468_t:CDS:1 n=1 Tax=Ambispora gerdemannii TaxID=144530 RepID=A0A9N9FC46_9GLOM|nr:6468_t:CDS:2 [Ambispora gerdemannii]